jgi:hypothetical protein
MVVFEDATDIYVSVRIKGTAGPLDLDFVSDDLMVFDDDGLVTPEWSEIGDELMMNITFASMTEASNYEWSRVETLLDHTRYTYYLYPALAAIELRSAALMETKNQSVSIGARMVVNPEEIDVPDWIKMVIATGAANMGLDGVTVNKGAGDIYTEILLAPAKGEDNLRLNILIFDQHIIHAVDTSAVPMGVKVEGTLKKGDTNKTVNITLYSDAAASSDKKITSDLSPVTIRLGDDPTRHTCTFDEDHSRYVCDIKKVPDNWNGDVKVDVLEDAVPNLPFTMDVKGGLSPGAIAGIVIACVVVVAAICFVVFWFVIRPKMAKGKTSTSETSRETKAESEDRKETSSSTSSSSAESTA